MEEIKKQIKKNQGKNFERYFKKIIEDKTNYFILRLKDNSSLYKGNDNPCDFILFIKEQGKLCLIELKTHKGKSLPFVAFRQFEQLLHHENDCNLYPILIIKFEDVKEIYLIKVGHNLKQISEERKSIPIEACRTFGYSIQDAKGKIDIEKMDKALSSIFSM